MKSFINKLIPRTNAFTFIFWIQDQENSLDQDRNLLYTFLSSLGVPSCVSPLHWQDVNEVDVVTGETEFKKWHFHFVLDFENAKKSVNQVYDLLDPIRSYISLPPLDLITSEDDPKLENCVKVFKNEVMVKNMRTLLRYFKHLDNPEKFQYIEDEYKTFGGFELDNRLFSQEDNLHIVKDILRFINQEEVYIFADLVDYALENNYEWFTVCSKSSYNNFIIQYMKSKTYRDSNRLEKYLDQGN